VSDNLAEEVNRLRKELHDLAMSGMAQDLQMELLQSDVSSLTALNRKLTESVDQYRSDMDRLVGALHRIANAYDDITGGPRFVAIAREALGMEPPE